MSKLDDLTLGELKEAAALLSCGNAPKSHSMRIGDKVFMRTVTYHYTGRITAITDSDIKLADAAWIADSSRYAAAVANGFGEFAEIEAYPEGVEILVSRGAIIDVVPWQHDLPTKTR